MIEPSTPSSFTGTIQSRPFSRGFKPNSPNDLLSSRVQTASTTYRVQASNPNSRVQTASTDKTRVQTAKTTNKGGSRGQLSSILESATKRLSIEVPEKQPQFVRNSEKSEIEISRDTTTLLDNAINGISGGRSRLLSPGSVSHTSSPRMSFLNLVSATVKTSKKEIMETELALQVRRKKERSDSISKQIKHTDIEMSVSTKADKEMVEEYENEILGTYKYYKGNFKEKRVNNGIL